MGDEEFFLSANIFPKMEEKEIYAIAEANLVLINNQSSEAFGGKSPVLF